MAHTAKIPVIVIDGQGVPGLPLWFICTGDMANQFEESYGVDITAKDVSGESLSQPGQRPHPPNMNFDKGSFENTTFTVQLFSGCIVNGSARNSGRSLMETAQTLYRLSMPQVSDKTFVGPPLLRVQYGEWWRAKGFFQKVTIISEGAWDREAFPTLIKVRMEFARHFGSQPGTGGGAYPVADYKDLRAATSNSFAFRG